MLAALSVGAVLGLITMIAWHSVQVFERLLLFAFS